MQDITDSEERSLPLPPNWVRAMSVESNAPMYRNVVSGIESVEHPMLLQALLKARKVPLGDGWVVEELTREDGCVDYFYHNTIFGVSCWDPPSLRTCLSQVLKQYGYHAASIKFLTPNEFNNELNSGNMEINNSGANTESANIKLSITDAYSRFKQMHSHETPSMESPIFVESPQSTDNFQKSPESWTKLRHQLDTMGINDGWEGHDFEDVDAGGEHEAYHDYYDHDQSPNQYENDRDVVSSEFENIDFNYNYNRGGNADRAVEGLNSREMYGDGNGEDESILSTTPPETPAGSVANEQIDSFDYENDNPSPNFAHSESEPELRLFVDAGHDQFDRDRDKEVFLSATSELRRGDKWEELRQAILPPNKESDYDRLHRMLSAKPPMTESGVSILQSDVREVNSRMHVTLMSLRKFIAIQNGFKTDVHDFSQTNVEEPKESRDAGERYLILTLTPTPTQTPTVTLTLNQTLTLSLSLTLSPTLNQNLNLNLNLNQT